MPRVNPPTYWRAGAALAAADVKTLGAQGAQHVMRVTSGIATHQNRVVPGGNL
jgi:hypothetical protein